jgi:FKBP-type peptidyl-prolyl cis-trans isomerase 2
MISIAKDTVVAMRYIMRNSKGVILEDTVNSAPVYYLHGSAGIQPQLQSQLEGLKIGDQKTVYLPKENGVTDDDFSFEIIIDSVRKAMPHELETGRAVQPAVFPCGDDCDCNRQ